MLIISISTLKEHEFGSVASVFVKAQFLGAVSAYIYNDHSYIYLNLYATIERDCIDFAVKMLSPNCMNKKSLEKLFHKKNLIEIAEFLNDEEIISKSDFNFLVALSKMRNSIAHKNLESLGKYFSTGSKITPFLYEEITKNKDPLQYIFRSVDLMLKLTRKGLEFK